MNLTSNLFCLIAIVIWSSLEITGKLVGVGIDPFTLTAWRFVIGGMVLLPFAIRQARTVKLTISSILHIGSLGILNVCVSMLLLQLSIYYGKASLSAAIISINPIFVGIFAVLILNEKLMGKQLLSLALGLVGLSLIVLTENDLTNNSFLNLPLGIAFAIGASLTFGLWTVLTKSTVAKYGNVLTNAISFLIGGIILIVINLVIGKPAGFTLTLSNIVFITYLGLVVTGAAYLLYFEGMKVITTSKASVYFFLKPVLAAGFAYGILHETFSLGQMLGITLIILSLSGNFLIRVMNPKRTPNINAS